MDFVADRNPTVSALYLVDRGLQGKHYRWFDADKDQWSVCGWHMDEALANKDKPSAVDFYPWVGPLTGKTFNPDAPVKVVADDAPKASKAKVKPAPVPKKMAKQRTVAVAAPKAPKASKSDHPDGTVWFRADRQKWIAQMNGKQEAARPTKEACLKFLKKKYNIDGVVVE